MKLVNWTREIILWLFYLIIIWFSFESIHHNLQVFDENISLLPNGLKDHVFQPASVYVSIFSIIIKKIGESNLLFV